MTIPASAPAKPLAGLTAWLMTERKAGLEVQVRGVADALGCRSEAKPITLTGLRKLAAPLGWMGSGERMGQPGSRFSPPWPAIAIGAGVASIPYLRAIRKAAGAQVFTVALQKTAWRNADLVAVPVHDRGRGPNSVHILTAPHGFDPARLAALRNTMPQEIAALPQPRVAVLLGGDSASYEFTTEDMRRLAVALQALGALGASFLITSSRRTQTALLARVDHATTGFPRILWSGDGANPYPQFLAAADHLIVTADSVNMTGEACATGRPVFVFHPTGTSAKFARFHDVLTQRGVTRPLPERLDSLVSWSYTPLDSAAIIAREIEQRWLRRAGMLAGMVSPSGEIPNLSP